MGAVAVEVAQQLRQLKRRPVVLQEELDQHAPAREDIHRRLQLVHTAAAAAHTMAFASPVVIAQLAQARLKEPEELVALALELEDDKGLPGGDMTLVIPTKRVELRAGCRQIGPSLPQEEAVARHRERCRGGALLRALLPDPFSE